MDESTVDSSPGDVRPVRGVELPPAAPTPAGDTLPTARRERRSPGIARDQSLPLRVLLGLVAIAALWCLLLRPAEAPLEEPSSFWRWVTASAVVGAIAGGITAITFERTLAHLAAGMLAASLAAGTVVYSLLYPAGVLHVAFGCGALLFLATLLSPVDGSPDEDTSPLAQ